MPDQSPRLRDIALCFLELGLRGFGGIAPHAYEVLVERRRWLDAGEFAEVLGLGQILPGANTTNMTAILGARWRGLPGVLVAVGALMLPSTAIALVLLSLVRYFSDARVVSAERTVVAAVAGLIIASGLKAARGAYLRGQRRRNAARMGVAALAMALVLAPHAGVVAAVLVAVPLSLLLELRR